MRLLHHTGAIELGRGREALSPSALTCCPAVYMNEEASCARLPYVLTDPGDHVIRAPRRGGEGAALAETRVAPGGRFFVARRGEQGVQQNWKGVASYATVGLEFGLSLLVGLFAGRWLDQKWDTAHWFTFIGGAFGMAAGYRAIYRAAKAANREAEREEAEERAQRQRYHDDHSKR